MKTFHLAPSKLPVLLLSLMLSVGGGLLPGTAMATATSLNISQVPLTMTIQNHPQVLIALTNSESMDGGLNGAIMTGSGGLTGSLAALDASSSPVNYTIPAGFTPPVNSGSGGVAPYTVNVNGTLKDNSPSRLNIAKASILDILQAYLPSTDFGLIDYNAPVQGSVYDTWQYVMSANSGFSFTSTPSSGQRSIPNPCYNYKNMSGAMYSDCYDLGRHFGASTLNGSTQMIISASSDDPNILDVLYSPPGTVYPVLLTDNGPYPATPYPPNFNLSDYNNNQVGITYYNSIPNEGAFGTSPTNAGYVAYTPQVMYIQRGFGYNATPAAAKGNVVVPMTTAGITPTASSLTTAYNKFVNYLAPETNNPDSPEIKAAATQSPIAGLMAQANNTLSLTSTTPAGCKALQYVVLITDGLPTMDQYGDNWPPLGTAAAAGYGVTATFNNTTGELVSTNDLALQEAINQIHTLNQKGIKVFVVGLGAGTNPTLDPQAAATLRAMAVAGGTGDYFPATSPAILVSDLNNILIQVEQGSMATTSAAVNSTGLNTGSQVFQASYTVGTSPYNDWTGNLTAYGISATSAQVNTGTPLWQSASELDTALSSNGWQNRLVATWDPVTNQGIPFAWSDLTPTQQTDLQPSDTLGQERLDYLLGDTSQEAYNGGPFRNRSTLLGDIIDSNPIYVGAPAGAYSDASYLNFEAAQASRPATIYVGANDGMLHAFNPVNGQEEWAFVPNAVFPNLINLTEPLYNSRHQFFVDASPQASDVEFSDGTWHTILVSGEGAGGNSVFALDVTNPAAMTSPSALASSVLWEDTPPNMGLSFGEPAIARVNAAAGFAVFFGNGYNSPTQQPTLEAVNAQTGALLASINPCTSVPSACNSSLPNGLSSAVAVNMNGLLGYPVDVVYAGDLQGNLWAFDVDSPNPSQWTVRLLFKATDASGTPQPITTPPVVSLNPDFAAQPGVMVYFGTGQLLQQSDLATTQTQSFYGVLDQGTQNNLRRSNLEQQQVLTYTGTQAGLPVTTRSIIASNVDWTTQDGWFFDLPNPGERVISDPRLDNGGVVFTTYQPSTNACSAGGTSFLMDVNYANGGAFTQPELDVNGDGQLNASDQGTVNGQTYNPVGMSLGQGYSAAPTILSANLGSVHAVKLITKASGQIQSVEERGGSSGLSGWWQW